MLFDPEKKQRHSMRMRGYDYTQVGGYFVTICTHQREPVFGKIIDGVLQLNKFGEIADTCMQAIPEHFHDVIVDEYMIMPNHVHAIIMILSNLNLPAVSVRARHENNDVVGARHASPLRQKLPGVPKRSLSAIVGSYKSAVSKEINRLREMAGITTWQRNYYDHIIRKDTALNAIRRYIHYNPLLWQFDSDNITTCRGEACLAPTLQNYGFTDEELDFIINYDIKYRMGKGAGEEDEDE